MIFKILNRWTMAIVFEMDSTSLKLVVEAAVEKRVSLSGANLSGANLSGVHLSSADLRGADLRGANLRGTNLRGAHLSGANLSGANLSGANLSGANLRGADLSGTHLSGAHLSGADLSGANLSGANLRGADLSGAHLSGDRPNLHGVPSVPNIHQRMLEAIENSKNPDGGLDMSQWHTCKTTHCRSGWAIALAGEAGAALEFGLGSSAAGALIHLKSCAWMEKVPNFYASDEDALADIRACAEREKEEAAKVEAAK